MEILPAPSSADLQHGHYMPSLTGYNDLVSGEKVVTSFSSQITRTNGSPAGPADLCPVTVTVGPVAIADRGAIAWITNEQSMAKAYSTLERFGTPKSLWNSIDKINHRGGTIFTEQRDGAWIRHRK